MRNASLKHTVLTLGILLIVCMGAATVVEKVAGKEYAYTEIYGSWWFLTLWGLLTTVSLIFLIRKKTQKKCAVFMLHLSFVVMLTGALVTHFSSVNGTLHLRIGSAENSFIDSHNEKYKLPFEVQLTDFEILTYPGTDAVMDYVCKISVKGKEQMSVSMNNIGKCDGYRFYQSAYDSDCQGTQLLVAYDPYGIAITYFGYLMLLVSFCWVFCSKHTQIRHLYRIATKPLAITGIMVCLCCTDLHAEGITPVSAEIAHEFGKVPVLYNNRICPINTAANEFVTKLCGKSSWNGYSADEIFVGWMIYYTEWEQQRLILVKNASVQKTLGIDGKWACVRDFYNADNSYKLAGLANDTTIDTSTRKAVRDADEKIQVITMFYNSEMLRIFPLSMNGKLDWYTPGSTELPLGTPTAEFQFINHAMDRLVQCILVNDIDGAKLIIRKILVYQREKAADVLPSTTKIYAEVFYNRVQSARWIVFACLTFNILFCILMLLNVLGRKGKNFHTVVIAVQFVFLTMMLALRWIISGHAPMSNGYETMIFMAWISMALTLTVMRKISIIKAFGPVVSSFCMLVSMIAVGSPQITQLMPVLQSPLLTVHVALIMMSYALIAILTMLAIYSLVIARKGDDRQLEQLTALSQLLLYPAVALLSIGIFVGAVWANVSWGSYWSWDPKETWALITMMLYALPLHRSLMDVSKVGYHIYILIAFLAVLMTYFGVNYLLTGMHSYA